MSPHSAVPTFGLLVHFAGLAGNAGPATQSTAPLEPMIDLTIQRGELTLQLRREPAAEGTNGQMGTR